MAVGGYGRGEMALHSDVDIAFVTPWKPTGWTESAVEAILYLLWDLGLKVGHSTAQRRRADRAAEGRPDGPHRDPRSALRLGRRGALRRGRGALLEGGRRRHGRRLRQGEARRARRAARADGRQPLRRRAQRQGRQRRAARPPRALLDRQICLSASSGVAELVEVGLLTADELRQFQRAERFLWAVRCHLHLVAGRAEERLTFDYQREIAARMHYADRPGKSAVERFMRHYFLHAKTVGDLTGVFLAHLDEKFARSGRRFGLPTLPAPAGPARGLHARPRPARRPRRRFLPRRPGAADQMFALADARALEIHPLAMRAAGRDAKLIDARRARRSRAPTPVPRRADLATRSRDGAALDERGRACSAASFPISAASSPRCSSTCTIIIRSTSIRSGRSACCRRSSAACSRSDHPLATALVQADRVAPRALCRGAAPRHRQGARRRP